MMDEESANKLMIFFPECTLQSVTPFQSSTRYDIFFGVPGGLDYFAWMDSRVCAKDECILLHIGKRHKEILGMKRVKMDAIVPSACYNGTIFTGVFADNMFCMTHILQFAGKTTCTSNISTQIEMMSHFLTHLTHLTHLKLLDETKKRNEDTISFKSPIITSSLSEMQSVDASTLGIANILAFSCYSCHSCHYDCDSTISIVPSRFRLISGIFRVEAELQNDIYSLYAKGSDTFVGTADISSYTKSVMMNSLFRKIKENKDLDKLEESDSEDEFEDMSPTKFIKNIENNSIYMHCLFNKSTHKWVPISVI